MYNLKENRSDMSVKLILSNTFDMAAASIFRELRLKENGGRNIVIAPDKFSLSVESNILKKLDIVGSFNIEVVSFTRFAAKTLKDKLFRCLTPEGSVMLLRQAVEQVREQLSVYKSASRNTLFPREIYAVITALRNSGIQPEALLEFKDGGGAAKKMRDIGLIYSGYLKLIDENMTDSSTRLQAFADYIPSMSDIQNCNIFILDFYEFTAPQYDIIEKLILSAKSVTIGLVEADKQAENARLTPVRAKQRILKICQALNVKPEIAENAEILLPYKQQLLHKLFAYTAVKPCALNGEMEMYVAPNEAAEVERIAKFIRYQIVEGGLRYRDIAVVVSDMEIYEREIKNIFERFDIPYFIDKKVLFSNQPAAKYIISALKAANGLSFGHINALIKNPFFYDGEEGYEAAEEFENYCLKYAVSDRLSSPFEGEEGERPEKIRQKAVAAVSGFPQRASVGEYARALGEFASREGIIEKCEKFAAEGAGAEVKASAQIFEKFTALTEELKLTLNNVEMPLADFTSLAESVFANTKIALVPLYLDSVFVGEPDESRYDDVKIMYIAGALEKKLPKTAADTAVIGTGEEAALLSSGIGLYPTKKETVKNNLFYLTHLLLKHKNKLIISYPESCGGSEAKPSPLISQLSALFSVKGRPFTPEKITDERFYDVRLSDAERARLYAYKFGTKRNGFYSILSDVSCENVRPAAMPPYDAMYALLSEANKTAMDALLMPDSVHKEKIKGNLGLSGGTFSASQLENYFSCPYKRYFQYGLRIRPRQEGRLTTLDTGTLTHAVAEAFVNGGLYENPDAERVREFVGRVIDESPQSKIFSGRKNKNILNRLKDDCVRICMNIAQQISQSDFKPYLTEAKIGDTANGAKFEGLCFDVGGKPFKLKGSIDRIDGYGGYYTVIDYKSYKKPLSIKDIYSGKKIQPVLYMSAVSGDEKLKYPVGLFYQPVSVGYKSNGDDRFKMKGFVIDDPEILMSLDNGLQAGQSSAVLPAALKKNGEAKKSGSVIPSTAFTAMSVYAEKLIETALNEIGEGNISPAPDADACKYCDYESICAFSENEDCVRRKFPAVEFDDLLRLANGGKSGEEK